MLIGSPLTAPQHDIYQWYMSDQRPARQIRHLRLRRGLTQAELAEGQDSAGSISRSWREAIGCRPRFQRLSASLGHSESDFVSN